MQVPAAQPLIGTGSSLGSRGLRRWSAALVALLVVVLGVAACGGGSPSSVAHIATTVSSASSVTFAATTVAPTSELVIVTLR